MTTATDKRHRQRVRLYSPLQAEVDFSKVTVVDISSEGARIEHRNALPVGKEVTLTLIFNESEIPLRCQVVRCRIDRSVTRDAIVYQSGLHFLEPESDNVASLLDILRQLISIDLGARKKYSRTAK